MYIQLIHNSNILPNAGYRDIYIDFYLCPIGCIRCRISQEQILCSKYQKIDFSLLESSLAKFNNDGWTQADSTKLLNVFDCNQNMKIPLIGLFNKFDIVTKIQILPPHYQLEIDIFFIYLYAYAEQRLDPQIHIDGKFAESNVNFGYFKSRTSICNTIIDPKFDNKTNQDIPGRIQMSLSHSKRIMNLTIFHLQYVENYQQWGFRDLQMFYKPCHASCAIKCKGPFATDCLQDNFYYIKFASYFTSNILSSFDGWIITNPYTSVYTCNQYEILGGYNLLQGNQQISYTVKNLQVHSFLSLNVTLYQIDAFNNDIFQIFLNDVKIYEQTLLPLSTTDGKKLCGKLDTDIFYVINVDDIPHTVDFATFLFQTIQTSPNGYWGIRNVIVRNDKFSTSSLLTNTKNNDLNGWQILSNNFQKTICNFGNYDFIGYFQKSDNLTRTIYNIPKHQQLFFQFKIIIVYKILISIISNVFMIINNETVWNQQFQMNSENKACDNTYFSSIYKFEFFIYHMSSDIQIEFGYDFQETDQKWGIRDLTIDLF